MVRISFPHLVRTFARSYLEPANVLPFEGSTDCRRLVLQREPTRLSGSLPCRPGTGNDEISAEVRVPRPGVSAERFPGQLETLLPLRIQRVLRGTVQGIKFRETPRLDAEQESEICVKNGAWRSGLRLIERVFLGVLHEVNPS